MVRHLTTRAVLRTPRRLDRAEGVGLVSTAARTWRTRGVVGGVHTRRCSCSVRRFSLAFFVLTGGFWYLAFLLRASRRHRHIMEQANMLPQVPEFPIEQALPYTSQEATPEASGALRPVSDWLERTEVSTDTPEERIFELERQQSSARRPDATAASSDTSRWNGPWRKSQLRAFLQRDESLLHHTASSCDQEFVGWELFDRWRRQRRVWCSQYDSEEDQTTGAHSELSCGKLAIPQHGDRYVCEGRNLSTSWALVDGVAGGDDVQAVMGQSEGLETYRYKPGFLTARCHVVELNLQPDGLQPPARDWFGALSSVSSDTELPCDEWIEDPVVVVSRVEYANFYHTMTDFVGTWSAAVIAGMDPSNVRILFADGHPKSPFDSAWGKIFSGGRPPLRKQDLANRRVCLRHAVFAFYGYASPMTINWFRADPCKSSSWLGGFSHQVLEAYGLERPSPAPCGADCSSANLTLILREDYVAHPRETNGGQRHNKIFNPDELLQVMRKRVGSHAQAVKMAFLSFEEQLSLVRSTNVLIGMHGAALTFLPFLADNAVVIELVPVNGMKKFHFQNLAAWSDKGFLLWRNSIAENEKDAMNTLVDPTQFDGLLSKALRKLDAPR